MKSSIFFVLLVGLLACVAILILLSMRINIKATSCTNYNLSVPFKIPVLSQSTSLDSSDFNSVCDAIEMMYDVSTCPNYSFDAAFPDGQLVFNTVSPFKSKVPYGVCVECSNGYLIAIRGTEDMYEWIADADSGYRSFTLKNNDSVTLHKGMASIYFGDTLQTGIRGSLLDALSKVKTNTTIVIGGHSLGSALSQLVSLDLATMGYTNITCISIATPRVFSPSARDYYADLCDKVGIRTHNILNNSDSVTNMPLPVGVKYCYMHAPFQQFNNFVDYACDSDSLHLQHSILSYRSFVNSNMAIFI